MMARALPRARCAVRATYSGSGAAESEVAFFQGGHEFAAQMGSNSEGRAPIRRPSCRRVA